MTLRGNIVVLTIRHPPARSRTRSMMSARVLLVEPDGAVRERLLSVAGRFGHVDGDAEFPVARGYLLSNPYDWVVTNIRLAAYNGLHLMRLAAAARLPARFVVYADQQDVLLAQGTGKGSEGGARPLSGGVRERLAGSGAAPSDREDARHASEDARTEAADARHATDRCGSCHGGFATRHARPR
jgi:hypothetical protein